MDILQKIENYYTCFNGEKGIIGYSRLRSPIYYFAVKKTVYPVLIVQCAIHAREHITARLCLKLIEYFKTCGKCGTVYFIPAVNPDGIKIALCEKPLYKANAAGVDLNVNFDAKWGKGEKNVKVSGDENYVGESPFSEPETRALRDFTLNIKPDMTLSFHCKGEEIYYQFHQSETDELRDLEIAKAATSVTGYKIKSTPNSCGGYKDWCIEKLKIPALTVEVGSDDLAHPIGEESLNDIFNKNKNLISAVIKRLTELKCN